MQNEKLLSDFKSALLTGSVEEILNQIRLLRSHGVRLSALTLTAQSPPFFDPPPSTIHSDPELYSDPSQIESSESRSLEQVCRGPASRY